MHVVKMDLARRIIGPLNGLGQVFRHSGHTQHTAAGRQQVSTLVPAWYIETPGMA